MENKKVLHLILMRKYFELILNGVKTKEYRDKTPYWDRRLKDKEYDVIQFRNGYQKLAPVMVVEHKGYDVIERNGVIVYSINLGNILEKRNCGIFDNAQI
tara:strand:+ start:62 stop:361 length:300 start_codon:yes stop_codon:yes gene_type:complete